MLSIFHKNTFLVVFLALSMVSLSCGLPSKLVPVTQVAPVQFPQTKASETSLPPVTSATDTPEQPTSSPEPAQVTDTPEASLPQADFGGVTFSYDPQIASSVSGEEVPATPSGQGAPWEVQPDTIKFSFDGYPVNDSFTPPVILIFPVKDYQSMSDVAANIIDELRQVIAARPQTAPANGFPFLPMWNAAQMMSTKVAYFKISNGTGVRYLTMYAQNSVPVNNKYLFYTYQGLTSGGKYYISAILPVTNAILPPDDSTVPGGDYQAFSNNFKNYIKGMQDKLDAQPEDAFVPSLTLLDDMIKSIVINH
jgi:hypothetical protein